VTTLTNTETIKSKVASLVNPNRFVGIANNISSMIYDELMKDIALLDGHTLKVLAEMGHPYATGEYSNLATGQLMRKGRLTQQPLPHVEPFIHKQSGNLADNVERVIDISKSRIVMGAKVDESKVPYIAFLVHGTTKMVPRPVFIYCWSRIKDKVLKKLEEELRNALRVTK